MPSYFSYIAKFDSPDFFWNDIPDDKYRTGNTPGPVIIPQGYPDPSGLGFAPGIVSHWTETGGLEGKQIDWGAWGMIVRKSDLEAIWKEQKDPKERPWQDEKEWLDVWNQIEKLEDDQKYVLVVAENP
jgi:hypothetical protein